MTDKAQLGPDDALGALLDLMVSVTPKHQRAHDQLLAERLRWRDARDTVRAAYLEQIDREMEEIAAMSDYIAVEEE